jgi:hypothetical protein
VAISWVRQQPGPVIPLIAARTEEQFRDNLAATDVHLSQQQHLDHLDALSRPTLGFPADVMREASVVGGVYGAQLPDIDDPARRPCAAPPPTDPLVVFNPPGRDAAAAIGDERMLLRAIE